MSKWSIGVYYTLLHKRRLRDLRSVLFYCFIMCGIVLPGKLVFQLDWQPEPPLNGIQNTLRELSSSAKTSREPPLAVPPPNAPSNNQTVNRTVGSYLNARKGTQRRQKVLTLCTTFTDHEDRIDVERNVILNWGLLQAHVNLVAFVAENSRWTKLAESTGWLVKAIPRSLSDGSPYLRDMVQSIRSIYQTPFYGYANADVLFTTTLVETISYIQENVTETQSLLLLGQRIDLKFQLITHEHRRELFNWGTLRQVVKGGPHSRYNSFGYDLFIFNQPYLDEFPDFVVSRPGFDILLPAMALWLDVTVVDISTVVLIVHQDTPSRWLHSRFNASLNLYNYDIVSQSIFMNHTFLSNEYTKTAFKRNFWYLRNGDAWQMEWSHFPLGKHISPLQKRLGLPELVRKKVKPNSFKSLLKWLLIA